MIEFNFLKLDNIVVDSTASSKKSAIELASELLVSNSLDQRTVLLRLLEREELGSTGIGYGIAIPHARLENLGSPVACFIKLKSGIDFMSSDDMPVTTLFCFAVPIDATDEHLQIISTLATLFKKDKFRSALNQAETSTAILELFLNYQSKDYDD